MASDSSEEEESVPFDMSWPESNKKRCLYLFILPITLPLSLTLPDVRKPVSFKHFVCIRSCLVKELIVGVHYKLL